MNSESKGARRVTEILDSVAQARVAPSSRQIFEQLGAPRSSGYDLLSGLAQQHYLQKRADGHWILGEEVEALAMSRFGLGRIACKIVPVLTALQEETQEIAQLTVLDRGKVLITHAFSSLRAMRASSDSGTELPVNWTAAGRVLLAGLTDRQLHHYICAHARPSSPAEEAATARDSFIGEVREARSRGYAISRELSQQNASAIAAPVLDPGGCGVAAVNLILPATRLTNSRDTLIALVCAAAARLSNFLADHAI